MERNLIGVSEFFSIMNLKLEASFEKKTIVITSSRTITLDP